MDKLTFRKASKNDAIAIADYLFLAMEEIVYEFIGEKNTQQAKDFLVQFTSQSDNQYSYQNCWFAEFENEIIGCACLYNGADLLKLRQPVVAFVQNKYNANFNPELETQAGEVYLDCISVHPKTQGKGFGSQFLNFLINHYVYQQNKTIGLLVYDDNPKAKKLYLNLGFKSVGKKTLVGKSLEHLQINNYI